MANNNVGISVWRVGVFATLMSCTAWSHALAQRVAAAGSTEAKASSARVSIDLENASVRTVVQAIADQANLRLSYEANLIPGDALVSVRVKNVVVDEAFQFALRGTGLVADIKPSGNVWILQKGVVQGTIVGKVINAKTKQPVSGATVLVDNETKGVATGEDGAFRISILAGERTLLVRALGMVQQSKKVVVKAGETVQLEVSLEQSASVLDEVVVTGTVVETQRKEIPNAITVVTAKDLEQRGITRIDQLFRGDIPGLFALELGTYSSQGIGSLNEVTMFSRGVTKMPVNGGLDAVSQLADPIKTYVDGVELSDYRYLSQIDPKSIERIEILTGPQASTIYGANAINGVMMIFTKRGTVKPQINLSLEYGMMQNNFSAGLAPSHRYDGSASGAEGRLSYNIGAGWDYSGAWTPGKQIQRTSAFGGARYQIGGFSSDFSVRQGWTKNRVLGTPFQGRAALVERGLLSTGTGSVGNVGFITSRLDGRTLSASVVYNSSWWNHRFSIGSDRSEVGELGIAPEYRTPDDSLYFNSTRFSGRVSQSYSTTLHGAVLPRTRGTISLGIDHWRRLGNSARWVTVPSSPDVRVFGFVPEQTDKHSGVYAQTQVSVWDQVFLTYGLRADWSQNYGKNAKVHPGRLGVSYVREIGSISAKLRGSYGRSVRPPTPGLTDAIYDDTGLKDPMLSPFGKYATQLANPELGPETQQGGEGGIELYFGSRGSLVVTRYNQTVDNLILNVSGVDSARSLITQEEFYGWYGISCGDLLMMGMSCGYGYAIQKQNVNAGGIRNQGWEMQGTLNFGAFAARGAYAWTKSRITGVTERYRALVANAEFIEGQMFGFAPEHSWSIGLTYALHRTSVNFDVRGVGQMLKPISAFPVNALMEDGIRLRQYDRVRIARANIRMAASGYVIASLNASRQLARQVDMTLQVENLNNHYQNDFSYAYPVLGRQTRFGIRARLW